jgi:hypothetical protein
MANEVKSTKSDASVKAVPGSSNFSFSNTENSMLTIRPTVIKPMTEYAKVKSDAELAVYSNLTCDLDRPELISYNCSKLDKVTTQIPLAFPMPNRSGVTYGVKVEDILRTITPQGDVVGDEPIVMYLTIRHQTTGNMTADRVEQIFKRLIGALYKGNQDDGYTSRFADLMRSALEATKDLEE